MSLPGAGVWHADFHWKDWDDWHRYFNLRNALITSALHSQFDPKRICRSMAAQLATYLVGHNFSEEETRRTFEEYEVYRSLFDTVQRAGARMIQIAVFGATVSYVLLNVSHIVLRVREPDLERPTESFSGGWLMRIALAKLDYVPSVSGAEHAVKAAPSTGVATFETVPPTADDWRLVRWIPPSPSSDEFLNDLRAMKLPEHPTRRPSNAI